MKKKNMKSMLIAEVIFIAVLTGITVCTTRQLWLILFGVMILASFYFIFSKQRNKYEGDLEDVTQMIEALISKKDSVPISETEEQLKSKIKNQLVKLNGIITTHNEQAAKDKQEIRTLIVEIAHQLRIPLSNIQTYLDLLKEDPLSFEEKSKYINAIELSERKLRFLIESFIKMSRLENKIIQIRKTDDNIKATINNAINQVIASAQEKQMQILLTMKPSIQVKHDRNWLGEAIFNLLDNAVKYSPEHTAINVNCIQNEMFVQIEIRDQGVGIKKGEEGKVFQRFYRGENVTNEEGFGLGLYISREIVSAHGGFMRVKRQDNGISFSIFLPYLEK